MIQFINVLFVLFIIVRDSVAPLEDMNNILGHHKFAKRLMNTCTLTPPIQQTPSVISIAVS